MSEVALLTAVRDRLRSQKSYADNECDVELDEAFPQTVGRFYVAVMSGGVTPGPTHNSSGGVRDKLYGVDVLVVIRATVNPRDRRRDLLLNNTLGLDEKLQEVDDEIDFSYSVLSAADALLTENQTFGFVEPLKFAGFQGRPRPAPAEMFGARSGETVAGLMRVAQYRGARRIITR